MNTPETAKRHTKGAALRKFDQLAGQIDFTKSQPQKQGRTFKLHFILILRWIADLVGAAGLR